MATTKKTVKKKPVAAKTATRKKAGAKKPKNVAAALSGAGMKKAKKIEDIRQPVNLSPLDLRIVQFEIEGLSSMLLQCQSEKKRKQMAEGRAGTGKKKID